MKKTFIILSFYFLSFSLLQAKGNEPLFNLKEEPKIFINNRIIARVNGKSISTYDLMKKMDLSFYRQYPEYTTSLNARIQFYEMSWKPALLDMIDKELILSDAKESKIEVSSGDLRQEIETSFGPNVIANLDKAGLTFEEASKVMQEEITIRRLIAARVHTKALRQATPLKIRLAYEDFIKDQANYRPTRWTYRLITIKNRTPIKTEETANAVYQLFLEGIPLDQIVAQLKERKILGRLGKVTVSNPIEQDENEISNDYKDILINLDVGMISQPFLHKSRIHQSDVTRLLFIEGKNPGSFPSYKEMESKLKENLLDKEVDQETDRYLLKLRQHYHIRQSDIDAFLPSDYQPFSLKNAHL